ncbi:hypothetical protein [Streptacidiphilus sp. P02-A3a]|uniref:hypothetical protein n=1 Tax=Streptacidiphilus sp. P02-A3a TaxID=2704468 RepID=UPI001CDC322B|nr:hypothetical protein [Streptacidiphilus sp. P02-A3a]
MEHLQLRAALPDSAQQGTDRVLVPVAVGEEAGLLAEAEVPYSGRVELGGLGDDVVDIAEGDEGDFAGSLQKSQNFLRVQPRYNSISAIGRQGICSTRPVKDSRSRCICR